MGKRGKQEKETLCWDCQNYSLCSWGRYGKPVKGWTATPTEFLDNFAGGDSRVVHSFLVEACPHFKHDKKRRIFFKEIAAIIGTTERYAYRTKERKGIGYIKDLLKDKGYKLHVCKSDERCEYFIEKLDT